MESIENRQGSFELQLKIIRENLTAMRQLADSASVRLGDDVTDEFFRRARQYCDGVAELVVRLSSGADVIPGMRSGKTEEDDFLPSDLLS